MCDKQKKDWEHFEDLIVEIFKIIYKNSPKYKITQTASQKDGGYDAYIIYPLPNQTKKALIESKFRSFSNKDLPLSDFSKTLIIAINLFADEVTIATNLHFSKQTSARIKRFANNTGIVVKKMNGHDVYNWITKENAPKINNELLQKFHDNKNFLKKYEEEKADYSISLCVPEAIYGDENLEKLDFYTETFSEHNFILLVRGVYGIGKSCFINNLVYNLRINKRVIFSINAYTDDSARRIFMLFLSYAWGLEEYELNALFTEDIEEIFQVVDQNMNNELKKAIKAIFSEDENNYVNKQDLWQDYLITYLDLIMKPMINKVHPIFVIESLMQANEPVFSFIMKILRKLNSENCSFIVECRNSSRQERDDEINCLTKTSVINISELNIESCKFLLQNRLNIEQVNEDIIKICSKNPLYLLNFYTMFDRIKNVNIYLDYKDFNLLNNSKIKREWFKAIINESLKSLRSETKTIIGLISLFNGKISYYNLKQLFGDNANKIFFDVLETSFFCRRDEYLIIKHVSYLHYFRKIDEYLVESQCQELANLIITNSKNLVLDFFEKLELDVIACIILRRFNKFFYNKVIEYINTLLMFNEYFKCLELIKYLNNYCDDNFYDEMKNLIKLNKLYCLISLDEYSDKSIDLLIHDLEVYIKSDRSHENYEKYIYLKCKYLLAIGEYEKIIDNIPPLYNLKDFNFYREYIWKVGCIALKHLTNLDNAITCLKLGLDEFPNSPIILYSLWTHLANITYGNLDNSISYFEKCKDLYKHLSLKDQLHNENNLSVCYFYKGMKKECNNNAALTQSRAFINGNKIEECRAWNTLALNDWCNENESVETKFLEGLKCMKYSFHATHIWPIYINLANFYQADGQNIEACNYSYKALEHLKKYYLKPLKFIKNEIPNLELPKYYIGLLMALNISWKLGDKDLAKAYATELLNDKLSANTITLVEKGNINRFLKHTLYLNNNHLMLKI